MPNNSGSSTNVRSTPPKEQGSANLNQEATNSPYNSETSSISEEGSPKDPTHSVSIAANPDMVDSYQTSSAIDPSINETKENVNPGGSVISASTSTINKRIKKPKSKRK